MMTWQSVRLRHKLTDDVCSIYLSGMYSVNMHTNSVLDTFKSIYPFLL